MKASELKAKSVAELQEELISLTRAQFGLRMQLAQAARNRGDLLDARRDLSGGCLAARCGGGHYSGCIQHAAGILLDLTDQTTQVGSHRAQRRAGRSAHRDIQALFLLGHRNADIRRGDKNQHHRQHSQHTQGKNQNPERRNTLRRE